MNNEIIGQLPDELLSSLSLDAPYRAEQIFQWIHNGASSFLEMTNLPKSLRSSLHGAWGMIHRMRIDQRATDGNDGSEKLTLLLEDGQIIETVLLIDGKGRKTACLSSQVGCAMGCVFCRTGTLGLKRNLTASEIIEQFLQLKSYHRDITHIVFMGMGEPLANLGEVRRAAELLHHPKAHDIGYRRITLSTCGLPHAIVDLGEKGPPVRLAVSLVTAKNTLRDTLMPVNRRFPLPALKDALATYQRATGKRITLEYVLIKGCNDTEEDIRMLAVFCRGLQVLINLIPWNPCPEFPFQEPGIQECEIFAQKIRQQGLSVSQRLRKGRGVNGACGQLAAQRKDSPNS